MATAVDLTALDALPAVKTGLQDFIVKLRRSTLPSHLEQVSALASVLEKLLESDSAKKLAIGQLHAVLESITVLIGAGTSAVPAWTARNLCRRVQSLLRQEAGKAQAGAGAAEAQPTLASIEATIAARAAATAAAPASASAGAAAGGAGTTAGAGQISLPAAVASQAFSGEVREAVLEGFAELQGETEAETVLEGISPCLPDLFRPGDALLLAIGCAGIAPTATSGAGAGASSGPAGPGSAPLEPSLRLLADVLQAAASVRPFELFVPEGGPGSPGRTLAALLSSPPSSKAGSGAGAEEATKTRGIPTTLIPDASVFAVLPRVTKVVVPTLAVAGDGSALVPAGVYPVALAANAAGKPVLALASLLHLCSPSDGSALLAVLGGSGAASSGAAATATTIATEAVVRGAQLPSELLPVPITASLAASAADVASSGAAAGPRSEAAVAVLAPLRELLPARIISQIVTDSGVVAPAAVAHMLEEHY